jgi:hypothetical protein
VFGEKALKEPVKRALIDTVVLVTHLDSLSSEGIVLGEGSIQRARVDALYLQSALGQKLGQDHGHKALANAAFSLERQMDGGVCELVRRHGPATSFKVKGANLWQT